MTETIAVRYAAGVVGEAQRLVHMADAPADDEPPQHWLTLCGEEIPADLAEVSQQPLGMPCIGCLSRIGPAQ